MFAAETPVISICARLSGLKSRASNKARRNMNSDNSFRDPGSLICAALAEMLPSTAEEIASATGLEPAKAAACLDELARRYRVMFNPLTKRFSLPKAWPQGGVAA
ncbi:MAG: hypothetical protein Tsb0032_24050 [Kiloniellaceae bacterium]